LSAFYQKVLPSDLSAARRMTYASLPALARKTNVKYEAQRSNVDDRQQKNSRLGHLVIRMQLQGDYDAFRNFLYQLETAPEFVIIDDVTIAQGDVNKPLTVTLELSTYYPLSAHGN